MPAKVMAIRSFREDGKVSQGKSSPTSHSSENAGSNSSNGSSPAIAPERIERLLDNAWRGLSLEAKLSLMEKIEAA